MAGRTYPDTVTSETYGSKDQLTNLNTQLADYIRNVRAMRVASVRTLGTSHYFETLEQMEGELMRIRGAYESELDRLRKEAKDASTKYQTLSQAIHSDRNNMQHTVRRLEEVEQENDSLRADVTALRAKVAGKDREIALYKEELNTMGDIMAKYRERQTDAEHSKTGVEKRLAEETQRRLEAEENVTQLLEKLAFMKNQHEQQEKEFQERLKASHNMITMLDNKLGELSKMGYDELPSLLQKIRDMTAADMRGFHLKTEENLNKTINALKKQMEAGEKEKLAIDQDKQVLQSLAGGLEEVNKDLQAQIYSLRQQNAGLKMDIEQERNHHKEQLTQQQERQKELQEELISKAREFAQAREAQAALRAEIETYRELLNAETKNTQQPLRKQDHFGSMPDLDGFGRPPKAPSIPEYRFPNAAGQPSLLAKQQAAIAKQRAAGAPNGYPRHWGLLKDPSLGPYQALPPIGHGPTAMDGILDTARSEPPPASRWSRYETTYKRSFSPDNPYRQKLHRN